MSPLSIPRIGFGCWELPADKVEDIVYHAIKVGYRHIDSAEIYGNETAVGSAITRAVRDGIIASRSDLFICSKLWATDWANVHDACKKSIAALQCGYLDLYLVHSGVGIDKKAGRDENGKPRRAKIACHTVWSDMESLVDAGLARAIGVSNWSCMQIADLQCYARIPCAVNQIEIHPTYPNSELAQWCLSQGIAVVAYCPLGTGKGDLGHPALAEAPGGAGRAALRWALDKGYHVITKSTKVERAAENLDVLSARWALSAATTAAIDAVCGGHTTDLRFKICNHAAEFGLPMYN